MVLSDWRALGACVHYFFFFFYFGRTHQNWVQHTFKNGTHSPYLTQMRRQSEQAFRSILTVINVDNIGVAASPERHVVHGDLDDGALW